MGAGKNTFPVTPALTRRQITIWLSDGRTLYAGCLRNSRGTLSAPILTVSADGAAATLPHSTRRGKDHPV